MEDAFLFRTFLCRYQIRKLNELSVYQFRLPTEAEWEYAAKCGKYWKNFSFKYSGSNKLNEVCWHDRNCHRETKPIGLKTPNLLGIHDMNGNIWEWCEDWYSDSFFRWCDEQGIVINPCNQNQNGSRVNRGGGWNYNSEFCRTTRRDYSSSKMRGSSLGFRLALSYPK